MRDLLSHLSPLPLQEYSTLQFNLSTRLIRWYFSANLRKVLAFDLCSVLEKSIFVSPIKVKFVIFLLVMNSSISFKTFRQCLFSDGRYTQINSKYFSLTLILIYIAYWEVITATLSFLFSILRLLSWKMNMPALAVIPLVSPA